MQVKVIAIDDQDRVKLSRKVLLREQNKPAGGETPPPRRAKPTASRRPPRADRGRRAAAIDERGPRGRRSKDGAVARAEPRSASE